MNRKQNKTQSEKVRNIVWTLFGIVIMLGLVVATTSITDSGTSYMGSDLNFSTVNSNIRFSANNAQDLASEGSSIELYGLTGEAKPFIGMWGYDPNTDSIRQVAWTGAHYNLSNGAIHEHWSLETLDNVSQSGGGTLNTKFEIRYGSNQSQGNRSLFAQFTNLNHLALASNVDLLMKSGSDVLSVGEFDVFPYEGQGINTFGLRVNNDSDGLTISALGGNFVGVLDNVIKKGNMDINNENNAH